MIRNTTHFLRTLDGGGPKIGRRAHGIIINVGIPMGLSGSRTRSQGIGGGSMPRHDGTPEMTIPEA